MNNKKNLLVIGAEGNLWGKIEPNQGSVLLDKYNVYVCDKKDSDGRQNITKYNTDTINSNSIDEFIKSNKTELLILTPPSTHNTYINTYFNKNKIDAIYCEKPLPGGIEFNSKKYIFNKSKDDIKKNVNKVKIIDHYIFKENAKSACSYIRTNRENIKSITINIIERHEEKRLWMYSRKEYGGVTYDLAHHAISIAILVLSENIELNDAIGRIKIDKFEYFDDDSNCADKSARFSFYLSGTKVYIHVRKAGPKTLKNIIIDHYEKTPDKTFPLNEEIQDTYEKVFADMAANNGDRFISIEQATKTSELIDKVLNISSGLNLKNKLTAKLNTDTPQILSDLNDKFVHRHKFYWSSFYRLFIYHVILALSPAFFLYYTKGITENNIIPYKSIIITSGLISLAVLFINIYYVGKSLEYLNKEDHRLKIIINKIREIYFSQYDINLYASDKNILTLNDAAEKAGKSINGKTKGGVGSVYMARHFKAICWVLTISVCLGTLAMSYYSYVNPPGKNGTTNTESGITTTRNIYSENIRVHSYTAQRITEKKHHNP